MKKARWWRNPKVRAAIAQVLLVAVVAIIFIWLYNNTVDNLNDLGIKTSTSFFNQVAPFEIAFSPFIDYTLGTSTYLDVFFIGILNTILVSVLGVIAATILGFFIGIMRLSPNWIIAKIASVYIETLRNIPLLLQLLFWNFAIFLPTLPSARETLSLGDALFLNNRGLYLPSIHFDSTAITVLFYAALAIGVVLTFVYRSYAKKTFALTGKAKMVWPRALALIFGLPGAVLLVAGSHVSFDIPELQRFNFTGGIEVPLALFVLWFTLSVYTSAFIAEAVRGGIKAVSHGQTEAALSLGLSRMQMLRLVIIPQAMRVIIPPSISQYLNLTKNSSLAVAIAYEEIVALWAGISLNQTGQALIIIAMTILVYEMLSLGTSAILNWYNHRVKLVER